MPFGLLAAAVMFLTAPIIPRMVGPSFADSVSALQWLCLLPVFRSLHLGAGDTLTGAGYQRYRTAAQLGAAGAKFRPQPLADPNLLMARSGLVEPAHRWQSCRRQLDPSRPVDPAREQSLPGATVAAAGNPGKTTRIRNFPGAGIPDQVDGQYDMGMHFRERLHSMRTRLITAALFSSRVLPRGTERAAEGGWEDFGAQGASRLRCSNREGRQDIHGRGERNPGVLCFLFAQIYEMPGSRLPSHQ